MTFARTPRPARQSTATPRPRPVAQGSGLLALAMQPTAASKAVTPKTPDRRSQAIRDSAQGEECTVRIDGCPGDPAMTIASHAPFGDAGKGMSIKALDLCIAYCCTYCDAVVDGQRPTPATMTRTDVILCWMYGHLRSLVRLRQKGLI